MDLKICRKIAHIAPDFFKKSSKKNLLVFRIILNDSDAGLICLSPGKRHTNESRELN
jgi:hypothetical protein